MTVEASVIVPLVTLITVILIFFFLFLLDMSVAKSETQRLADEVAASWKTNGALDTGEYEAKSLLDRDCAFLLRSKRAELEKKAERRMEKRLKERLCVSCVRKSSVRISSGRVISETSLEFLIPLRGVDSNIGGKGWKFSCCSLAAVSREEELLRKVSAKLCKETERKGEEHESN